MAPRPPSLLYPIDKNAVKKHPLPKPLIVRGKNRRNTEALAAVFACCRVSDALTISISWGRTLMKRNIIGGFAVAAAFVWLSLPVFAADLPRSGKYSGHYGWTFSGQVQKLGEDRTVYSGVLPGVMFNNEGKGFMHKARVDCTLFNDVNKGRANANGSCIVTDADGDKVFVEWKCSGPMPTCPGTERFVGGTGKYKGISGEQKFQGNFIGETGAGWSDWSGDYKLP